MDFESLLEQAIDEYKVSPDKRGKIPPTASNLRESLEKNCGLTEKTLNDWPCPDSVHCIYWRKRMMQATGSVVAALVILIVTVVFAVAYNSLDAAVSAAP